MSSYSRTVQVPGKNSQELYEVVSEGIEKFLTKASIGKFTVDRDPARKELKVKSSMFSALLSCTEEEMTLDVKLGLLAMPFKSKLDDAITRWLSKTFNLTA